MLELFAGRMSVSRAFVARGWKVTAIDLVRPAEVPEGVEFVCADVLQLAAMPRRIGVKAEFFGFLHSWSVCEKFSVFGMKHFHPDPPFPEEGIRLFEHSRTLCERAEVPYIMENVRPAQQFVGRASHHYGPFYLWGPGVPPLLPSGKITKGIDIGSSKLVKGMTKEQKRAYRAQFTWNQAWSTSKRRQRDTAKAAEIPPELASCVADYACRITEPKFQLAIPREEEVEG